jgi:UDP-glucose 4-epimerase
MILVTGGAGFIGSHLVDALCSTYDVAVIDDLSKGRMENLRKSNDRISFHKMNILDKNIRSVLEDVEIVFHLAAQANVRISVEDPFFDLDVNVKGLLNIVENATNLDRFIFASSGGAIYGEPEYLPADEEHKTNPISPYGVSKLAGEKYLNYYTHTHGLKTTCLRYSNVYGERQDPYGEAGVISIFIDKALNGEPPEIFGDGKQTRDYIHVSDIVSANLHAMKREGTFNIGTGVESSVNQLVEVLSEINDKELKPVHTAEIKGEVRRTVLSIGKARAELGWQPKLSLKEGMQRTFDYFKKKRN